MKLGHVHLKVSNLEVAERFYTSILGLQVTERVSSHYLFLSFGSAHHDLALQALGANAEMPSANSVGLYHTAFEVPDAKSLLAALVKLEELNNPIALVDHKISWAIYSEDPDGNGVEIYLDRRNSSGGDKSWQGASRRLTKEQLVNEIKN